MCKCLWGLAPLASLILFTPPARGQSTEPAVFVAHYVATAPQFDNYASVASFTVNANGTLNFVGIYYTNDYPQTIAVSPDGRFLAVGHGTSSVSFEDLLVFRVNADASLTMFAVILVPDSPLDVVWLRNDVIAVTETSSGDDNRVHTYLLDDVAATVTPIDSEPTGTFNAWIAAHPSGDFLYAQESDLGGQSLGIRTFSVNPDGSIDLVQFFNTTIFPLCMAVTPDGSKLYSVAGIGSFGGNDPTRIHGFHVSSQDGSLSLMSGSPFVSPGSSPAYVDVSSEGDYLYVGHGQDATVHSFSINPVTGELIPTGFSFDVGSQGDIGELAVLDDILFVTREFNSTQAPRGLFVLQLGSDGSMLPIGNIVDTQGKRPQALAVWNPQPVVGIRGDMNCDGLVNEDDVDPFTLAQLDPVAYELAFPDCNILLADMTQNSLVDGLDILPFVDAVLNPAPIGACCAPDAMSCVNTSEEACAVIEEGLYQGDGTDCGTITCPDPLLIFFVNMSQNPISNCPGAQLIAEISGSGFDVNATVKLIQPGQPDLIPGVADVVSPTLISPIILDTDGAPTGSWQWVVENPGGATAVGPTPLTITSCP